MKYEVIMVHSYCYMVFFLLALGSWITLDFCNALGVVLHIWIGVRKMDRKTISSNICHDDN